MTKNQPSLQRKCALALSLSFALATVAQAQTNTAGAISGHAASGDTITVSNPATGFTRTITVDSDGAFRVSQLPIGRYTVTRNGDNARQVNVSVGTASAVDFVAPGNSAAALDTVTVVGSGAVNPIDVSSVESTTILTSEQIAKIPVARDTTSVALLAPGTVRGDAAFGNLASFGGSSVAENQYYVNGFNITNSFRSLNFSNVPFEAIAEQQIKTGGYGAEFGRSLGGVVNQITKRGTNDFHAGGNVFWSPKALTEDTKNTYLSNPLACGPAPFVVCTMGQLRQDNSKDSTYNVVGSVWASGALIEDKVFAYGLVSYRRQGADAWGIVQSPTNSTQVVETPAWLLKMDWNITEQHLFELTAFSDKQKTETDVYSNTIGILNRLNKRGTSYQTQGGTNYVLKYTGYLTDSFTLSALYGHGEFSRGQHLLYADGTDVRYSGSLNAPANGCPVVLDIRPLSRRQVTGEYASQCNITAGALPRADSKDTRDQFRVDAEWQLGDHLVRFGYDQDDYTSIAGTSIEGGRQFRYSVNRSGVDQVRERVINQGTKNEVKQHALYVQDSWNVTDNFVAYIGGRWDTFDNRDGFGKTFVKIDNQFGPRLGFSWDVDGDSTFKVFGNAGRYALPLTSDVATRAASASLFQQRLTTAFTGVDPFTGAPLGRPNTPFSYINGEFGSAKNNRTVAAQDLKPMYQDEYILGLQKTLSEHFTLGVRGIYRDLKAAIDDNCDYTAILDSAGFTFNPTTGDWVDGAGRASAQPNAGFPYCRLFNPGDDAVFLTDLYGDGNLTPVNVAGDRLSPKAKRTYSAVEFFFDGNWDKFFLQGSYTYAKSKGNTEGGVKSDIGQANTGITQDFDYRELTVDTYGYLPNDRRHTLKVFGNFEVNDEWSIGANVLVQSGRPVNCFGILTPWLVPGGVHPYGSSFARCGTTPAGGFGPVARRPRGTSGRLPWTNDLDINVAYRPAWMHGLQFKVDVFNVLNSQKVTSVNEIAEDNPSGLPLDTYLTPASFQAPRSVRFMVQYDF
ncbi:Oar protein [Lysobacter helvus]|uniref:Oar protein n=2 Tax=Lysobacteraceae TaxID=32033 RepID=A0ABM7Q714_9GAMM|nr:MULTISPECIES: TonB-dependent receptor [Lysobacter]BCT93164.1 Oar protein [Lysobacter caseinilyticus]BCT96316.1 Oar protein [Lysobacter helvus]